MKLTIGMPSYNNYQEVVFTVQALRMYQNLEDCELLVIDNYGSEQLERFCKATKVRYIKWNETPSSHVVKNQVFKNANGRFTLCIDSHIFLMSGVIKKLKNWIDKNQDCPNLLQGPMVNAALTTEIDFYKDEWRGNQWGTWGKSHELKPNRAIFEIQMTGSGLMCCKTDEWVGFNESFIGFGAGEGYIHEKFRKHGKKVMCLPFLEWWHYFRNQWGKQEPVPYPLKQEHRIHNYLVGFRELGLDLEPVYNLFGREQVNKIDKQYFGS